MKKIFYPFIVLAIVLTSFNSCEVEEASCGTKTVSGVVRSLNKGPEGGCYYINSNGNKSYVDRSDCTC